VKTTLAERLDMLPTEVIKRSLEAIQLLSWQYRHEGHNSDHCPLCAIKPRSAVCSKCPWVVVELFSCSGSPWSAVRAGYAPESHLTNNRWDFSKTAVSQRLTRLARWELIYSTELLNRQQGE
jgi:hypothetical protein